MTTATAKGLRLSVYRSADPSWPDTTLGGVSASHHHLTLVGIKRHGHPVKELPREAQVFEASDEAPAVVLVESAVPGLYGPHLEPLEYAEAHNTTEYAGPMDGGNLAGTSDSRWSRLGALFNHDHLDAVPVHDRVETWATYRMLSSD
jgi:hypothetical protein